MNEIYHWAEGSKTQQWMIKIGKFVCDDDKEEFIMEQLKKAPASHTPFPSLHC